MSRLALQRCWNHSTREAVARCPECERSFCRECVVEHEGRIICSGCLAKLTEVPEKPARKWSLGPLMSVGATCAGLAIAWLLFYDLGRYLISIPSHWHAKDVWEWYLKKQSFDIEP